MRISMPDASDEQGLWKYLPGEQQRKLVVRKDFLLLGLAGDKVRAGSRGVQLFSHQQTHHSRWLPHPFVHSFSSSPAPLALAIPHFPVSFPAVMKHTARRLPPLTGASACLRIAVSRCENRRDPAVRGCQCDAWR